MPRVQRDTYIITLDTETLGFDGAIKRIAIYDGYKVHYGYKFEDIEPILDHYHKCGFNVHVYIHNLEFDARKMPKVLCKENTNWNNTLQINNRYAKIACKKYTFHDSWRLLPASLDDLSKDFGVANGKMDLWEAVEERYPGQYKDKSDYFMRCDPDDPLYVEYLGLDVISLYEVIKKLEKISGLTPTELVGRVSTASMSKYIFKNGYKGRQFKAGKDVAYKVLSSMYAWNSEKPLSNNLSTEQVSYLDIEKKIRAGYYGGRTEVFTPWAEPFHVRDVKQVVAYHYDVNSLYPSVMIDHEYPVGFPEYTNKPDLAEGYYKQWLKYHEGLGFIKCAVYIPEQDIPPLPVHMGKLVFPTGHVEGTWTYNELEFAIKNCGVVVEEYQEIIHFKKTSKVFKDFVETFYAMKEEGKRTKNKSMTAFAKLILNTAYGWTVLNRDDKTELKNIDKKSQIDEGRILYEDEELGFINIKSFVDIESIQPQIGAYVTSYSRLTLLEGLLRQRKLGKVYYCDTDSIVCEFPMASEFVDKYRIGAWDLEGELYEGIFVQPKVYYEDKVEADKTWELSDGFVAIQRKQTIKFKGVSRETSKKFNRDFYKRLYDRLASGDTSKLTVEKNKTLLRSIFYAQKRKIDPNRLEYRDKQLNLGNKQKRNMDYAGNSSMAWYMDSLEMFHAFTFARPSVAWKEIGNIIDPCPQQ